MDAQPVDLYRRRIPADVLELLPASVVREHRVVPIDERDGTLVVAMADPPDRDTIDKLRFILNRAVEPVLATPTAIGFAIRTYYGESP